MKHLPLERLAPIVLLLGGREMTHIDYMTGYITAT
jgi:hypothetical protein